MNAKQHRLSAPAPSPARTGRWHWSGVGAVLAVAAVAASLTGCYVVPMHPAGPATAARPATPPAVVATPVTSLAARLYPANEQAKRYGVVHGTVTSDLSGRGTFNAVINGERFSGEATRQAGSSRDGNAHGAGERGNFVACRYRMNSSSLGSGQCRLSDGAEFAMHLGG